MADQLWAKVRSFNYREELGGLEVEFLLFPGEGIVPSPIALSYVVSAEPLLDREATRHGLSIASQSARELSRRLRLMADDLDRLHQDS